MNAKKSLAAATLVAGLMFLMTAAASSAAAEDAKPKKVAGPPEVAWKDLSPGQKGKFMKAVVVPKFKPLFQTFDADAFKTFDCATCHGKDAKARKFKMPSPDVHPLPGTPEAFQAKMKAEPTWPKFVDFMKKTVEPQMAETLALPQFDFKKPEAGGFGCQGCHTIDKGDKGDKGEKK